MRGQWRGQFSGDNTGELFLNIDESKDFFSGLAYLVPKDEKSILTAVVFQTKDKDLKEDIDARFYPVNPYTGEFMNWESIKDNFNDNFELSKSAKLNVEVFDNVMKISALTDIGVNLRLELEKSNVTSESKIKGQIKRWAEFKEYLLDISKSQNLFRGQKNSWPLCTSFHRKGRFRIDEFVSKDRAQLHQRLSALTKHFFDLRDPEQNGAFFNLLQHHGYPTPFLDWSHSPYVATFFAFRDLPKEELSVGYVRIFIFDYHLWTKTYRQSQNLNPPFLHLSVAEFIAINNPRLIPQQSVTTATNIHDIESYILEKENQSGMKFLNAIDIPKEDRKVAMDDLRFMGIAAGSMFPSLDGICEEMRERNFDR